MTRVQKYLNKHENENENENEERHENEALERKVSARKKE